jgi:hypothetical protein
LRSGENHQRNRVSKPAGWLNIEAYTKFGGSPEMRKNLDKAGMDIYSYAVEVFEREFSLKSARPKLIPPGISNRSIFTVS